MLPNDFSDITIFGRQTSSKKLELMSRAHVLLVPGVREGWGLVVTEASAMGTPSVAYDVAGLRDSVVDGVTGKLVAKDDHLGMALETIELINDHIKRKTFAKNGMENAKQFKWETTTTSLLQILNRSRMGYPRHLGESYLAGPR
jgi:glycosyltransferase involved in cell wall biosynthesis